MMKQGISNPKYSIVMPILNGEETLSVTLPAMLRATERDDVEWVISNNHSEDRTKELVLSFQDPRIRYVEPPERLPAGKHLDFVYTQARGEWQGHLGDDDILFPSRFTVLDRIIDATKATMVRGEFLRYHWPNYPIKGLANCIDARTYSNDLRVFKGNEMAARELNEKRIFGGGAWCTHRSIIEQVRARCGFFSSPQHVEFFAMRAAMALSPTVAVSGLPIYIIGRHEKSAASQGLRPKSETHREGWDWSFEDPDPWKYCPWQYKGYMSISLDAVLMLQDLFPEVLGQVKLNWLYWLDSILWDIGVMIRHEHLPPEAIQIFSRGLKQFPLRTRLRWRLSRHPLLEQVMMKLRSKILRSPPVAPPINPDFNSFTKEPIRQFGWPKTLCGDTIGVHSIVEVTRWVEKTFSWFFPSTGPSK
jgi:glycosyltransferase involved in cell wall biosynthesis